MCSVVVVFFFSFFFLFFLVLLLLYFCLIFFQLKLALVSGTKCFLFKPTFFLLTVKCCAYKQHTVTAKCFLFQPTLVTDTRMFHAPTNTMPLTLARSLPDETLVSDAVIPVQTSSLFNPFTAPKLYIDPF